MSLLIDNIVNKYLNFISDEAYPALFETVRRCKELNFLKIADDLPLFINDDNGKIQYELIDRIRICTYDDESLEVHF